MQKENIRIFISISIFIVTVIDIILQLLFINSLINNNCKISLKYLYQFTFCSFSISYITFKILIILMQCLISCSRYVIYIKLSIREDQIFRRIKG